MDNADQNTAEQLVRDGVTALRNGQGGAARRYLESAVALNLLDPQPHFLLAQACRFEGDRKAEESALEKTLLDAPNHLPALLMMGETKIVLGDDRAASAFFSSAIRIASQSNDVPQTLHPLLDRAQSWIQDAQTRFAEHMRSELESLGINKSDLPPRATDAIAMLLGEKELYVQQPTMFYFPGLPQRQFYERGEFSWVAEIEQAIPSMQDELNTVLQTTAQFDPYIEISTSRPQSINPLAGDNKWGSWYFWKDGEPIEEHLKQCPKTAEALELAPRPQIKTRSPMALYSVLEPGAHIIPHHGGLNTRLICHIPLVTPEGCAIRVGNEMRQWQPGQAIIFDDSIEHEAWNRSQERRIILLFDIWRPEINDEERVVLTTILEAVERYSPSVATH